MYFASHPGSARVRGVALQIVNHAASTHDKTNLTAAARHIL